MTESINMGDFIDFHSTHEQKKTGNTIATVIGIAAAALVLAILWFAWIRNAQMSNGSEKNTNLEIGELRAGQRYLGAGLNDVIRWERADALKIAYTDGALYGRPAYGFYGGGERHEHHCCGSKSKFQEVKTFTPGTDEVTLTTTCNGC